MNKQTKIISIIIITIVHSSTVCMLCLFKPRGCQPIISTHMFICALYSKQKYRDDQDEILNTAAF